MLKRKKSYKSCWNQNMPALPLSDDLCCWSTIMFSSNCSMQRIRVFLSANEPIIHRILWYCCNSLLTFSVMESRWKWVFVLSCIKLKCLKPFIHYSEIKRTCGYVVALDSRRCCSSACCYDYSFQSCSTDVSVLQIQPWITSDPVIACVFPKVTWCLGKVKSCDKKCLQTF